MRVISNSFLVGFYLASMCLCLSFASYSQTPPAKLALNRIIKSEIKGGETQVFLVSLLANQTARIEIVQNGVDVSLTAVNPKNQTYIRTESPSGLFGDDLILVTADEAGEYKIGVTPANPRAKTGKYTILLKRIRNTIAEDFEINKAAERVEKLAVEAYRLKYSGTVKGRRDALVKWEKAAEVSKIKKDRVWKGISLLSRGLIFEQLGELQNALDVYTASLDIWRDIKNRQYEGSVLNNIAVIYNDFGEFEKAVSYFNQAIGIQREIGNRKSEGIYLNNLAYAYLSQKKYDIAEKFFRQALAIKREDKRIRGKRSLAVTLHNLGTTLSRNGKISAGMGFLKQSLGLRRSSNHRWGIASSFLSIGKLEWDLGEKQKAFLDIVEANKRSNRIGDRRMEAESFYFLAVIEKDRNNIEKAIENITLGLHLIEQIRNELIGSRNRYAYFSTVQDYYELYIDLLVSRFEKTKNRGDIARALEISEQSRSRSLIELLREAKVDFGSGIDADLLEKKESLQEELDNKYQIRQTLLSRKTKAEKIAKVENEISALSIQVKGYEIKIRRENPRYFDLMRGKTLSVAQIQNILDDDTVLIEYKLGTKRSFAWYITKNSIEISILPPRKEIEKRAKAFYDFLGLEKKNNYSQRRKVAKELFGILFPEYEKKIRGKRLSIVAEGVLQYIPFSALSVSQDKSKRARDLVDEYEVNILPSVSVLAEIRGNRKKSKSKAKGGLVAVFADPVFDKDDSRILKKPGRNSASSRGIQKRIFRDFKFGDTLPRLLASRQEARYIAKSSGDGITLKTDFDANIENIEGADLSKYRILHFATHGLLNSSNPELSGLVFSLFDKDGESRKGFLGLNDVYNLNLSSDMVVLSACQTALGKDVRGEGLIGLSRGFLYAGSKRIVASLWKVDDFATAEFMRRFYRNLLEKGLPASRALREAKMEMKKIYRYRSPFYWSAFTLLGDWK